MEENRKKLEKLRKKEEKERRKKIKLEIEGMKMKFYPTYVFKNEYKETSGGNLKEIMEIIFTKGVGRGKRRYTLQDESDATMKRWQKK